MTNWQPTSLTHIRVGDRVRRTWVEGSAMDGCYEVDLDARTPDIPVGTTGTATVRGVKGVQVRRIDSELWPWGSTRPIDGKLLHIERDVSSFTPDEILTDERVEQIRAEERERIEKQYRVRFWGRQSWVGTTIFNGAAHSDVLAWLRDGAK